MKDLANHQHFVGCDVSKNTLDFAIYEHGKDYRKFEHVCVPNTLEGFRQMRSWLRSLKIKVKDCVIAMEHTGVYSNALAEWCFKKGITFVMLHPLDVKNAGCRGRNKADKIDAQFIADYVYTMREKLSASLPEPTIIKRLRELRNERRLAVRTRSAYMIQKKTATDKRVIDRMEKMITALTQQVRAIEIAIMEVIKSDEAIKKNYDLMLTIPGVGMINALTTIIATGNFTRFQTARQYAKFCCVSPLTCQSGISVNSGSHVCGAGHHDIKSVLTEAARSAIYHDAQLAAYYRRKREQGKSHGCIMNAVKFKLICRIFAVIQRQKDYVNTEAYRS